MYRILLIRKGTEDCYVLSIALLTFYSSSLIAFPFARNLLRRIGNNYQLALKNQDGIFKLMT